MTRKAKRTGRNAKEKGSWMIADRGGVGDDPRRRTYCRGGEGKRRLLPHSQKGGVIPLRPAGLWEVVPGERFIAAPRKQWRYGSHPYLSGEVKAWRLDIPALGLTPFKLQERGMWDPKDHYWGEPDEPVQEWAKLIMSRGPRTEDEREQVLPGEDPDDPDTDPILEAVQLKETIDSPGAHRILMSLLAVDLRCLDAHAHLGNFSSITFPRRPSGIMRPALESGNFLLAKTSNGELHWGDIDNRRFLRCIHGYGLCLSRLGRLKEAEEVFTRILWLNPTDNQEFAFSLKVKEKKVIVT